MPDFPESCDERVTELGCFGHVRPALGGWTGPPGAGHSEGMAKANALDRAAADLARGRTQPAIQRLSSLVTVYPTDLDLRRRLAAVHRMVGNRIEAGRWAYLDPAADRAETEAFERAYPTAARRLAALRWPLREGLAPTEYARQRLDALAETALMETGAHDGAGRLGSAVLIVAGVVATAFTVIGLVTVIQWLM